MKIKFKNSDYHLKKRKKKSKSTLKSICFLFLIMIAISIISIYIIFTFKKVLYFKSTKTFTRQQSFEKDHYFCCFCVMGRMENKYTRELITYYRSIGVDKFVIADNNAPGTEKFSDVIPDYISNKLVDLIDIIGKSYDYSQYYEIMYEKYQNRCDWLAFFDFDEYLVMHNEEGKNITMKEYLSNETFGKCEAIQINWLLAGDNDLVYYDNRTSIERFTKPSFNHPANRFVKILARGNLNKAVFTAYQSCHMTNRDIVTCNSAGKIMEVHSDTVTPELKYAYLLHFVTRTAEEYVQKVKRGYAGNRNMPYNERVHTFFTVNKVTEEKVKVFEKHFNRTFQAYHLRNNN